ncbi:hypothetical protein H2202_009814 [Exophiala xenobiotica]|nr:hypothetical protein H2202_009814 [Exophiala xenobiotica]
MSATRLTDGHIAKLVRDARDPKPADTTKLKSGEMQLFSYYKPSLEAGDYVIEATQTVTSGNQSLQFWNTKASDAQGNQAGQEFEVVVPRFSLDPKLINSYYPPDGHQDEARILPHLVLNDPHYPWEISPGKTQNLAEPIDPDTITNQSGETKTVKRSMVPWVALLVFNPDDLHFTTLDEPKSLNLPGFKVDADLKMQNANGTFSMQVKDYFSTVAESARIDYAAGFTGDDTGLAEITGSTDLVNIIFPTKDLVTKLFSISDSPKPMAPNSGSQPSSPQAPDPPPHQGIEQYKYMAHVRHINTEGCPDAGVEEEGMFSIVVSPRPGALHDSVLSGNVWKDLPSDLSQPRTQVVHLISIEHLDSTLDSWINPPTTSPSSPNAPAPPTDRVGLVSLFSWIYQTLPPNPVNFVDTMRNLTENRQMLRIDDKLLFQLESGANAAPSDGNVKSQVSKILADRLKMGYTLSRWRTQTGEESTALNRGALVPLNVPSPPAPATIPDCSTTSQDYQILDPQTGLMDLSYSSAWQLGKLLAISDTAFSAALMRFRSVVRNAAADNTRMQLNDMTPGKDLFKTVLPVMQSVQKKSIGQTGDPQRIKAPVNRTVLADVTDSTALPVLKEYLQKAIASNAASGKDAQGNPIPYTGFDKTKPSNSDWPIIHDWLAEKLLLGGIPPQYLIPEPSFVPPESLRFFYIDDFWLDCLLDGALSVANHMDEKDDFVRREIKKIFNGYLDNVIPDAGIKPQIPCCGFIIRSKLVKAMPDMRITVKWNDPDNRSPVCRWTKWDDQTLMCLLDRQFQELSSITLAQPQHQQRYAIGSSISAVEGSEDVTFVLARLSTQPPGIFPDEGKELSKATTTNWLNFPNRCLRIQEMANGIHQALLDRSTTEKPYVDKTANSCEVGLELNDPSYFFQLTPPPAIDNTPHDRSGQVLTPPPPTGSHNRQLFVRDPPETSVSEATKPQSMTNRSELKASVMNTKSIPSAPKASSQSQRLLPTTRSPHQQLRMQPRPPPNPNKKTALPPPAGRPSISNLTRKFKLIVFADYKGPPTRVQMPGHDNYAKDDFVPARNIFYFDLIFDLRKVVTKSAYHLVKIAVDIPMHTQNSPTDAIHETLVSDTYDGAGVRMLSNQRFIPFLTYDSSNNVSNMHIELIPRSTNLDYEIVLDDDRTAELSFRLAEPRISDVLANTTAVEVDGERRKLEVGKCLVRWTEYYSTSAFPDGEATPFGTYAVIKTGATDDKVDPRDGV